MALKKPCQQATNLRRRASPNEAEALANKLYSDEAQSQPEIEKQARTSISLPESLIKRSKI